MNCEWIYIFKLCIPCITMGAMLHVRVLNIFKYILIRRTLIKNYSFSIIFDNDYFISHKKIPSEIIYVKFLNLFLDVS